jgi:hypothetical protein
MALGSTQPLTEMSTRNLPAVVKSDLRVRQTTSPPSMSRLCKENVGASTSHSPKGLHGLLHLCIKETYLYCTKHCIHVDKNVVSYLRIAIHAVHCAGT